MGGLQPRACLTSVSCPHPLSLLAACLAFAAGAAQALDADAATPPMKIADGNVQIGDRRVHLPAGEWTLVQVKDFQGAMRLRDIDVTTVWAVLLHDGRFGMAMQLSLPLQDMARDRRTPDKNPCTTREGVLRGDYSRGRSEMECLAVFGHHDLQEILQRRGPHADKWLRHRGIPAVADGVEVTYSHRAGLAYGRVAFYFPAADFESDDAAAAWARAVQQAFEPLIERKATDVTVPALPAPSPAAAGAAP
jgi:hypothetical protein